MVYGSGDTAQSKTGYSDQLRTGTSGGLGYEGRTPDERTSLTGTSSLPALYGDANQLASLTSASDGLQRVDMSHAGSTAETDLEPEQTTLFQRMAAVQTVESAGTDMEQGALLTAGENTGTTEARQSVSMDTDNMPIDFSKTKNKIIVGAGIVSLLTAMGVVANNQIRGDQSISFGVVHIPLVATFGALGLFNSSCCEMRQESTDVSLGQAATQTQATTQTQDSHPA